MPEGKKIRKGAQVNFRFVRLGRNRSYLLFTLQLSGTAFFRLHPGLPRPVPCSGHASFFRMMEVQDRVKAGPVYRDL